MERIKELQQNAEVMAGGIQVERYFTIPGIDPFEQVEWERRTARIMGSGGAVVFEQPDVEFPKFWSQRATDIVAQKYFRGKLGSPEREWSVRQMIGRVADTITRWGIGDGYFDSPDDAAAFRAELTYLLLHQMAAFNSPVWFNVGFEEKPQCSACFILSIEDNMESILEWYRNEGMIFRGGSGSGINLSNLRSSQEQLSKGGKASGPVSFMRGADAIAGTIKSGGKTRRAAKMVVLNVDHPDILEFIWCKAKEERKAYALGEAGYDMSSLDSDAWISIQYQNANNSVRVSDEFMRAVLEDRDWHLRAVTTGEIVATHKARELMRQIAEAAWECGDPGMQYDTTINEWHTCPNSGRINASNPCSEYMHLDNSACNLASLNLMKFYDTATGQFDIAAFRHAVDIIITAQEIIVGNSSYPTERITMNAKAYRQLGIGYANLGALLMARGLPYDSDEGRAYAATITALLTGEAYAMSARIAEKIGPFAGYAINREPMLRVIRKHRESVEKIDNKLVPDELLQAARQAWDEALMRGELFGYRNAQASVLAPTGTIAFLMDCDTTGIEPDIALVKYKKLVGGGQIKMINHTVPVALRRLAYSEEQIAEIMAYLDEHGTIEGAPHLRPEHLPVFDCAFRPANGTRSIHYMGHIRMMGAVQPFISGAISKTCNLPHDITPEQVAEVYIEGWKHGLKALAIYRDGSKRIQPLTTSKEKTSQKQAEAATPAADAERLATMPAKVAEPVRRRLPDTRRAITHHFTIHSQDGSTHDGYITVGMYEDGSPGEIFVTVAKEGSTISGLMDAFATAISIALQYGVPLEALVKKFSHMRFEPSGVTTNPEVRVAKSLVDYIFRWLASQFLDVQSQEQLGVMTAAVRAKLSQESNGHPPPTEPLASAAVAPKTTFISQADAPPCPDCGQIMVRNGSCYRCHNCGSTSGCS
ncbi:MAG: vitamin B12-dependent ribonucleotide reductase [Acidobacteriota bacterium]|nr:vitamin B12-dependent ribonucleotide reductase [Blastocatellia bacterium]MDW8239225.1 vitamin B12-dependent ribonucleotide reductase [Acidobacteriota bacterium]